MTEYPFVPKSNRYLRPGQFFAVPLSDGRYAAGRVTAVPAFGPKDRNGIVVGLVDWSGPTVPTAESIAGRQLLHQAKTRFDTITATGGAVLGERDLAFDRIKPMEPTDHRVGTVTTVWGRNAIRAVAEEAFVPRPPRRARYFVDFPTRAKAEAAARKLRLETEVSVANEQARLAVLTETRLPMDLAEGQFRGTAKMLGGSYAGCELM